MRYQIVLRSTKGNDDDDDDDDDRNQNESNTKKIKKKLKQNKDWLFNFNVKSMMSRTKRFCCKRTTAICVQQSYKHEWNCKLNGKFIHIYTCMAMHALVCVAFLKRERELAS